MNLTPEEKAKIVARSKEIGMKKAAEEFGISYYAVRYMRYYEKKHPGKKKEMPPETENIILKEKLSLLTEQRDKLKAAVASLA